MHDERMSEGIASYREPERVQTGGFLARPGIFKSILNWLAGLAGLFQLTEKEEKDAGIDLGYQRYQ